MTITAKQLLEEFDHLVEEDKKEVAAEILRRILHINWPTMSDEELISNAEAVFLEMNDMEQPNAGAETK